jgi:tRNA-2-methylthio-N6-dimethylallyladenosine synthase
MPSVFIKTFGCQMNEHDSQKMEALLRQDGYGKAATPQEADLVVINTCSIREKSYQKALSEIGRLKKQGKGIARKNLKKQVVAVTGCVVSHDAKNILKRFPIVDLALGPDHEASLPAMVRALQESGRTSRTDFKDISDYEFPTPILWASQEKSEEKAVKAYVTIMKGCDNTCSFCIVPFVRGKEVSRPADEIIDEIRRLTEEGVREVTLLGQNVNSYGKRLSEKTGFAQLLRRIDEETSVSRLRFTTPHPKDLSDGLIEEYGRNEKLCPHIHLPVQSGSNRILKKMRRSYTREVYLRKVEKLKKVLPEISITSDIIVGFPGETDEDFEKTLSIVREVAYDASYSFLFSPRPNTEASQFADDVPLEIKKERLVRLQALQEEISLEKNSSRIGVVEEVLVEGDSREGSGQVTGRTPHGRIANFNGDERWAGAILKIEVTGASPYSLKGKTI